MREISREEHELLLNLFVLEFFNAGIEIRNKGIEEYYIEDIYWQNITQSWFKPCKDCFPMDEVCEQELFSNNRECYYKAINWIKEV